MQAAGRTCVSLHDSLLYICESLGILSEHIAGASDALRYAAGSRSKQQLVLRVAECLSCCVKAEELFINAAGYQPKASMPNSISDSQFCLCLQIVAE